MTIPPVSHGDLSLRSPVPVGIKRLMRPAKSSHRYISLFQILAVLVLPAAAPVVPPLRAQDPTTLILEDEEPRLSVRPQTKDPGEAEQQPVELEPQPTPEPAEILVAIVNARVLTLADIQARVTERYDDVLREIKEQQPTVLASIGPDGEVTEGSVDVRDRMAVEEQERLLEAAIRREEEAALQDWVAHALLADEARRQGVVVTETEFRERLREAERQANLTDEQVDSVLAGLRFHRDDYERAVYDALMIEKLLHRFIDLNITEDDFRRAYDRAPEFFYEPARYHIAHFTVTFTGTEDRRAVRDMHRLAREVRDALDGGAEPEQLFARPEYRRMEQGILGTTGWVTFNEPLLPRPIRAEGKKLDGGDVSNVLELKRRGQEVPDSLHVIKVLDKTEATGRTFESALPAIRRAMVELARTRVLAMIREARSHRIITNLGGIPADKIPTAEEVREAEGRADPINLALPGR